MGRLGIAGDGVGADQQEPRLPRRLATIRPAGLFLANLAVLFFSWLSGDQFLVWGWRIPFLLSIVMVGIGLWIRLGISETPVFQKVLDEERVERVPVLEVLKRQPEQVALTALLRMPEQAPGYIVGTFIFTYATTVLGAQRNFVLMAVPVQAFLGFSWIPVAGHLSDRIERKRMYIIGSIFPGSSASSTSPCSTRKSRP
jgi:MFS family permease